MINILYLHSGAELYGADQILLNIVSNIDKKKFTPFVVLPNDGPLAIKLKKLNIHVDIIDYPIIRRKYFNAKGIYLYIKEYKQSINKLFQYIKEYNINIIHDNTLAVLEGTTLSKKAGIPVIMHIHEMIDKPKLVAKAMYAIAVKNSSSILAVSESVKAYICSLVKVPSEKITVIRNGITGIQSEDKGQFRKKYNIPEDAVVFGNVGRINAIKGQKDFIDALLPLIQKNKNCYGLIVGDAFSGQEWRVKDLQNYLAERKCDNRIILTGFQTDMSKVYNAIDVLVLSSVRYDSFPTVILEAMSCGKAIIAYRCGGVVEMIDSGISGYLVELGNKKELSRAMALVLKDENLRQKMGVEAKKKFEKEFTLNTYIKKMEAYYVQMVK